MDTRLRILKVDQIVSANTRGTILAPGLVNIRNVSITTSAGSVAMTLPSTCVGNVIIYSAITNTFALTLPSASTLMAVVATRGGPIRVGDSFKTNIINTTTQTGSIVTNVGITFYPPAYTATTYIASGGVLELTHVFTNTTDPAVLVTGMISA